MALRSVPIRAKQENPYVMIDYRFKVIVHELTQSFANDNEILKAINNLINSFADTIKQHTEEEDKLRCQICEILLQLAGTDG